MPERRARMSLPRAQRAVGRGRSRLSLPPSLLPASVVGAAAASCPPPARAEDVRTHEPGARSQARAGRAQLPSCRASSRVRERAIGGAARHGRCARESEINRRCAQPRVQLGSSQQQQTAWTTRVSVACGGSRSRSWVLYSCTVQL